MMDRQKLRDHWKLFFLGTLCLAVPAAADTIFAEPPKSDPAPLNGEEYPESRFGRAPARVNTGVRSGYARNAVEDMEDEDRERMRELKARGESPEKGTDPTRRIAGEGTSSDPTPTAATARKGVQEVSIIANDLGFFPKTVFVSRDVPVRLFVTGATKNTLCIMMDAFQIRRQIRTQKIEEITFTPSNPGKFRFYCPVNGMEGTLIVKEFTSRDVAGTNENTINE